MEHKQEENFILDICLASNFPISEETGFKKKRNCLPFWPILP